MEGIKKFTNNSTVDVKVILTVRAGETPGCIYRTEEFFLRCAESKQICYGNECNNLLDGLKVFSHERGQCVELNVCVINIGCHMDKLLNTHNHIIIYNAGPFFVFSAYNCRLDPPPPPPPRPCC
jgi:hypothetical protein